MKYDILIKGGHVVDPFRNINKIDDILINNGQITALEGTGDLPELIVDAHDCVVTPGLIDFHTHVFYQGTENSVAPDISLLPSGVTTAVDGGSAGSANFEAFYYNVICRSMVRIIAYLNISSAGQTTAKYDENLEPSRFDSQKILSLFEKYKDFLTGLKIRFSRGIAKNLDALEMTLDLAKKLDCSIMVHPTNPPTTTEEIVGRLGKGDIFTHVYHGVGDNILDKTGKVKNAVWAARQRGVIFDAANGRNNFSFKIALPAIREKFYPNIISSDLTPLNLYRQPAFGMPFLMSKYMAMGMSLENVIAAATATPAMCLGRINDFGTLVPGACADVAIFKLKKQEVKYWDVQGENFMGTSLLVPQMTIKSGQIVYKAVDFGI